MSKLAESKKFYRFLEIVPGVAAWLMIIMPLILSFIVPVWVAVFILVYAFYWLCKTINISRHMVMGFIRLRRNMHLDWLELCKNTQNIKDLAVFWEEKYRKSKKLYDREDLFWVNNSKLRQNRIKKWQDITHVIVIAVSRERLDILDPTVKAITKLNYPLKKIIVVFAAEDLYRKNFAKDIIILKKRYANHFRAFKFYYHIEKEGEVRPGKGPNITNAGRKFWSEYNKKLNPKNTLVTNLDADHLMHKEYLSRLTYLFVTDPSRHNKSYQPIPLLFNNIWDAPALNRIGAVTSSFWQLVEGMRSFRMRTFAAHTQTLKMLLDTDFWSVTTIVEDGHQYWRSYFALKGDHHMVPLYIPVYQDAVMGESLWDSIVSHYKQKRRWAWGVTDFPYVVTQSMLHNEIPLSDRLLQIFRQFSATFTWATSSFVLAFSWIPLYFNRHFQDTVIAHNIAGYSSQMLRLAWIGLIINVWISMIAMPPRPKHYGFFRTMGMVVQWVLGPVYAIALSSLPALEAQTRLMFNKRLGFYITPKLRKNIPKY